MAKGCHLSPFFSFWYFAGKKCTKKVSPAAWAGEALLMDQQPVKGFCLHLGQLKYLTDVDEVVILNDAAVQLIDLVPAAAVSFGPRCVTGRSATPGAPAAYNADTKFQNGEYTRVSTAFPCRRNAVSPCAA